MATTGKKCCESVYDPGRFRPRGCSKNATVERDGKPYCGLHDPDRVEAKRAERHAKLDRQWAAERAAKQQEAERQELERLSGIRYLTHDELRAVIAAGGIQAMLGRCSATTTTGGGT